MGDLHSARDMQHALTSKTISAVELLHKIRHQIDRYEPLVQAFISLTDNETVMKIARRIDERRAHGEEPRKYAGIPIAIKDNIAVAGRRLTAGSKMLDNYVSPYSATAVERLEAAGLVIVGKTNMDEFGFGSSTENSAFHATHNPRDLSRVPGGTSGGSAAAVAAGFVPWALGTDTGGSIRQPAALCGVTGIRPTYGRVSRYGLIAYASSMDQIGPIANTVEDAQVLLGLIMGPDGRDSTSRRDVLHDLRQSPRQYKIGIPREYLGGECQPDVISAVHKVMDIAERFGWEVRELSLPLTEYALSIYYLIASVEAASNLARYDGLIYGYHPNGATSWETFIEQSRTEGFGSEAKRRIMLGTFASSAGYQDKYYLKACQARSKLIAEFEQAFMGVDLLVTPISPSTAWPLGEKVADPMRMYLSDIYSVPAALAGLPSLTLPVAADAEGLPIGIQICGPVGNEPAVISAAASLEAALAIQYRNDLQVGSYT